MGKRDEKVNPQCKHTRFTKEFKLEAVRLLERGEKPEARLALAIVSRLRQRGNSIAGARTNPRRGVM
jgi:transposase-like protein